MQLDELLVRIEQKGLVDIWRRQLGVDITDRILKGLRQSVPTFVRINQAKTNAPDLAKYLGVDLEKLAWVDNGYLLSQRPGFGDDPWWQAGAYYVQEASSMIIARLIRYLDLPDSPLVLDACGAPGGKSTLLLDVLPRTSFLLANEVQAERNLVLRDNLTRWGRDNVIVSKNSTKVLGKLPAVFDLILVDAPCSGEGLLRKNPQAIYHWSEHIVQENQQRQLDILRDLIPTLKPGGWLIYSTCTLNTEENEQVIQKMRQSFGDLEVVDLNFESDLNLVDMGSQSWRRLPSSQGEGFCFTLLRRKPSGFVGERWASKYKAGKNKHKSSVSGLDRRLLGDLVETPIEQMAIISKPEPRYYVLSPGWQGIDEFLQGHNLYLKKIGVQIAGKKGKSMIPSHELALSVLEQKTNKIPGYDLNQNQIGEYLQGKEIAGEMENIWVKILYKGIAIGLAKGVGDRLKNHFPKSWRIT